MENKTYPETCYHADVPCYLNKYRVTRTRPCETIPCGALKEYQRSGIWFHYLHHKQDGNLDLVGYWEVQTVKPESEVREYLQRYFRAGEAPLFQKLENLKAVDGGFGFEIREPYRD